MPPWCFIKFRYPPATVNAVSAERADKPVSNPAEIAGRSSKLNLVVIIGLFPRIPIGYGVEKTHKVITVQSRNANTYAAGFFTKAIFPSNST
jgi:hypothetical protein